MSTLSLHEHAHMLSVVPRWFMICEEDILKLPADEH